MAKTKPAKTESPAATSEEPTPAERMHTLRSILHHKIDSSRSIVASLAKDLADPERRPLEILAWSSRAFEAAAVLQVALDIEQRLDTGESIADVYANILREALRGAKSQPSSTSPASNFAAACRTSALAEIEELLRYDAKKLGGAA